jgi:hypothetical protein
MLFFKLVLLTGGLLLFYQFLRRSGLWINLALTTFLPLCLSTWWISQSPGVGWFPWLKLYSVALFLTWMNLAKFTELGHKTWWRQGLVCLLLLNILEAVIQDSTGRELSHWLVVISGILVMLTLPSFHKCIQVDFNSEVRDVIYSGMNRRWIIEYSIWNWAFVFLNFPQIAAHQLAVLGAAAIVGFREPRLWLQARGYTLMGDLMLLASFPNALIPWTDTENWSSPTREWIVSSICLLVILGYSVRWLQTSASGTGLKETG